jgi:predicted metal-dependent hydrolase
MFPIGLKMTIQINQIIRLRRKSIHLLVDADVKLIVKAPARCSNRAIRETVERHQDWILQKQKWARKHHEPAVPKNYITGERFLYLGDEYELVTERAEVPLTFDNRRFILAANHSANVRQLFIDWYTKEALRIVTDRVNLYSGITNIKYRKVNISNAKTRWGACSYNGNLHFSWTLIMAPLEVIDYVVVHELCHIKIRNHSSQFWQTVNEFIPEYKLRRKWLKENRNLLTL